MRRIRLTENQFNRLVAKCVKRCLNEDMQGGGLGSNGFSNTLNLDNKLPQLQQEVTNIAQQFEQTFLPMEDFVGKLLQQVQDNQKIRQDDTLIRNQYVTYEQCVQQNDYSTACQWLRFSLENAIKMFENVAKIYNINQYATILNGIWNMSNLTQLKQQLTTAEKDIKQILSAQPKQGGLLGQ